MVAPEGTPTWWTDLYVSGTTFFTLGLGDVTPHTPLARVITVLEAGTGFGFLAIVIGYIPVIYQSFSRREVNVSLLDARAGSPPSAVDFLRRVREGEDRETVRQLLYDWERWAADLMESHLSYPVLCFFRSQHDNQSWLAGLTVLLDVCALILSGVEGLPQWQARLTFAMARHAAVDLTHILNIESHVLDKLRLTPSELSGVREELEKVGMPLRDSAEVNSLLFEFCALYEPYVLALSDFLLFDLPSWTSKAHTAENWRYETTLARTSDDS
jgi:hypothetical protein